MAEFSGCDKEILNDLKRIETALTEAARQAGATVVERVFHKYNPHGLSGMVVIAESHLSIHTWPEYGYAALDFFTCGERVNPWEACRYMQQQLHCTSLHTEEVSRGIPSPEDEILPHKPVVLSN